MSEQRLIRILSWILLIFACLPAARAQCSSFSISTTGVAFGTYDPLEPSSTTSTGTIEVSCTGEIGLEIAYSISLDRGFSGTYQPRRMIMGEHQLEYNFYTAAFSGLIWGDGTSGTQSVPDLVTLLQGTEFREYNIFGIVPPGQHIPSGVYSDTIVVTVTF